MLKPEVQRGLTAGSQGVRLGRGVGDGAAGDGLRVHAGFGLPEEGLPEEVLSVAPVAGSAGTAVLTVLGASVGAPLAAGACRT